jgi:hypothetical protein
MMMDGMSLERHLHLLRRSPGRRTLRLGGEALLWLAFGCGLEIAGRHVPSDWVDLLIGAVLLGLGVIAAGAPLGFSLPRLVFRGVRWLGLRLEALFDAHYGADFHPERPPQLKHLTRYRRVIASLVVVDLALFAVTLAAGSPLLAALKSSYILYLALGTLTWLGIAVALASLILTLLQQLRLVPGRGNRGRGMDRRHMIALWIGLGVGTAILLELDLWLGPLGWLAAMGLSLLALAPPRLGPPIEFRLNLRVRAPRGAAARLESTTVEEMVRSFLAILVLTALGLALVIQGHRLPFAAPAAEMPTRLAIAHYLGRAVAWVLGVGTLLGTGLYLLEFSVRRRRSDPAVAGPEAVDRARVFDLVRTNLDLARAGRRDRGEGFLFAPHWWPSDRMYRDAWHEDDLSEGSAGPDFHRHYGQPARRLLRRVLRSLEIDLIYIEDGVPSALVPEVFEGLFKRYDTGRAAGRTGLDERELAAPPGLHLALQEIELDVPSQAMGPYKEPSYESLSRARVLLILRARGGNDDPDGGDPFAFTREPGWVDRFLSRIPVGPSLPVG